MKLHTILAEVTARITERSRPTRQAYLQQVDAAAQRDPGAQRLGCANVAHAFAAMPEGDKGRATALDKIKVVAPRAPNIGIVNAYNDLLSAHAPLQHYPDLIKDEARKLGATAQVAGGVPAMCDGVTQGTPGMELSLFSRDVIAMATAVSLSHDVFDRAGPADRGFAVWPFAHGVCARRPDDQRPVQQRQIQGARTSRARPGRPP